MTARSAGAAWPTARYAIIEHDGYTVQDTRDMYPVARFNTYDEARAKAETLEFRHRRESRRA